MEITTQKWWSRVQWSLIKIKVLNPSVTNQGTCPDTSCKRDLDKILKKRVKKIKQLK